MLISAENKVDENICHIFQQRRRQLALKELKAGRCRLHLSVFEVSTSQFTCHHKKIKTKTSIVISLYMT